MITFGEVEEFVLFSKTHFAALATILFLNVVIFFMRKHIRKTVLKDIIRYGLGITLIAQEISLNLFRYWNGTWSFATSLPLHLCGFAVICCAIIALTKNEKLYSVVYFWGIGGATMALITPDLSTYGFPHFRFYQFFISHGLIVTTILYMTFIEQYRPTIKSFRKSFVTLNLLLIPIGLVNYLTGGNYFFIARPPQTASLIDLLGPWPFYILWFEVLGLVLFALCYIPFAIKDIRARRYSINRLQF